MEFQFTIPQQNNELLNNQGNNYCVKEVYNSNRLQDLFKLARKDFQTSKVFYIFDHFDSFFSLIENIDNVSIDLALNCYEFLFLTNDKLGNALNNLLQNDISNKDRNDYLNATKMILFLIIKLIKAIDTRLNKPAEQPSKTKKNSNSEHHEFHNWDSRRYDFLVQLHNLIQLPLEKLWDPPIPEESFVNLFTDVVYRTLEHKTVKTGYVGVSCFQLLGVAIKRYNHAITFPIKILNILQTSEISISPIANGAQVLYEEFGLTSIFSVLITSLIEIVRCDAADSQTSKNLSLFLTELGSIAPKLMIPHLSTLGDELLNLDSYTLRNAVLQTMSDAITSELSSEELTADLKELRDEFLNDLLAHIMDVSALVRSKVLQMWSHMKELNAVPLAFQHEVLRLAVERLEDKSSIVRKQAVILIKSFLENNPFAAKLSLEELKTKHEQENETLQKLRETVLAAEKEINELSLKWVELCPEILPVIINTLKEEINIETDVPVVPDMKAKINECIKEQNYREAILIIMKCDFLLGITEAYDLPFDQKSLYLLGLLKTYYVVCYGPAEGQHDELTQQDQTVQFLEDCITFSEIITNALPKLKEMLMSKTSSDVFETIELFSTAYQFNIKGTESGLREMLALVWSQDDDKRDAVTKAYKNILFTTGQQGRSHLLKVVDNISNFMLIITVGEFTALEELCKEWVECGDINSQMIQLLFERFTKKIEDTTENESLLALKFLVMISAAKPSVGTANMQLLQTILEDRGSKNPKVFIEVINILINTIPHDAVPTYYKRYDRGHSLFKVIEKNFTTYFFFPKLIDFDSIAINVFNLIYGLCQAPDLLCQSILYSLTNKMLAISKKISQSMDNTENIENSTNVSSNDKSESLKKIPTFILSRLLFLIGFIATKEIIFLDIDVYNNMKYRQELKSIVDKKKIVNNNTNKNSRKTLNTSASNALKRLSVTGNGNNVNDQETDEMVLVGATAEDNIAELITYVYETELLFSTDSLLKYYIPIIRQICQNPGKYDDSLLQQSAVLSLIRLMTVSTKFCEDNIELLMNLLKLTSNPDITCNIIIGLSDLTFRFPNIIEPWSKYFYETLHHKNTEVRLTAVKILSHLIMHEMILVKVQISDLAMCIVDDVDEIRSMTQQFFKEITNKSNVLYNILPEIMSRLSDININLEEEKYHEIVKFLVSLLNKDKQVESLVEKLCLRFSVTTTERQWRDIGYCLTLLQFNEKAIRKMITNVKSYKEKLFVDDVHKSFKQIIINTGKLAKPELKTALAEFEAVIEKCLTLTEENEEENKSQDSANEYNHGNTSHRKVKPTQSKATNRRNKKNRNVDYSDSSDSEKGSKSPVPQSRKERTARNRKVTSFIDSDGSSEESRPINKKGKNK